MQWPDEAIDISTEMWAGGSTSRQIVETINDLMPNITRNAVIAKMTRLGVRTPRVRVASAPGKPRSPSKRISLAPRKAQRLVEAPRKPQETFKPIPLTDATDLQCHRVIGPVVWRGISLVCGKPLELPYMKMCEDCKKELGIAFR